MLRPLRLLLALVIVAFGLVLTTNAPAFACSCAQVSEQKLVDRSDVVFIGTVERAVEDGRMTTYDITASWGYKGAVARETSVVSSTSGAACGLEGIRSGQDYLFLARGTQAPFNANLCGGTGKATDKRVAAIEAVAGEGAEIAPPPLPTATRMHVEESPPAGFARTAAPGAAAVVVGLLGLLLVGLRARRG